MIIRVYVGWVQEGREVRIFPADDEYEATQGLMHLQTGSDAKTAKGREAARNSAAQKLFKQWQDAYPPREQWEMVYVASV